MQGGESCYLCEEQEALGHREEGMKFPIRPRGGPTFLSCFHGLGAGWREEGGELWSIRMAQELFTWYVHAWIG